MFQNALRHALIAESEHGGILGWRYRLSTSHCEIDLAIRHGQIAPTLQGECAKGAHRNAFVAKAL
ncbi:MAG: hypothetical protein EOP13_31940 [Pseudomonas sp.]|uniref:hypothetical protein n=1 Tax=Pseudomonas sp. TaxID=306 RepID=UPI0012006E49|nr:hypothetical protein [Pseudomonas sp.]RZI65134.1 MAG: hypothetical protein EOP13_31940 [Pseudomonas sp.]